MSVIGFFSGTVLILITYTNQIKSPFDLMGALSNMKDCDAKSNALFSIFA